MSNLISIQEANQDPAVQLLLPEVTALSVEANWGTIMNNFGKIGGWIMQGSQSPNPLPPVLQAAADQLHNNSNAVAELREAYKGIQGAYTKYDQQAQDFKAEDIALYDHIVALQKEIVAMKETIAELQTAATPAKKTRAKKVEPVEETAPVAEAEPVIETAAPTTAAAAEPDQVELTAAAVGAGALDGDSLAALDGILMSL